MAIDTHQDFGPKSLTQLDITGILQTLLDQVSTISTALAEQDKEQVKVSTHLDALTSTVSELNKLLKDQVTHPRDGVIARVESHEKLFNQIEREKIIEITKSNKSKLDGITKALWIVLTGLITLSIRVLLFNN
jgi:hypothetical protein